MTKIKKINDQGHLYEIFIETKMDKYGNPNIAIITIGKDKPFEETLKTKIKDIMTPVDESKVTKSKKNRHPLEGKVYKDGEFI